MATTHACDGVTYQGEEKTIEMNLRVFIQLRLCRQSIALKFIKKKTHMTVMYR